MIEFTRNIANRILFVTDDPEVLEVRLDSIVEPASGQAQPPYSQSGGELSFPLQLSPSQAVSGVFITDPIVMKTAGSFVAQITLTKGGETEQKILPMKVLGSSTPAPTPDDGSQYCLLDPDLLARMRPDVLLEWVDDDKNGVIDTAKIERIIMQASGEIDGYLQRQYSVPLDSAPQLIRGLCCTISIYRLAARRGLATEGPDKIIRDDYTNAVRTLDKIAEGRIKIGATTPAETSDAFFEADDRVFSKDSMKGW